MAEKGGQQKCIRCGRFMRKAPDYQVWACKCGGWSVGLVDFEHMQIATEALAASGCMGKQFAAREVTADG